MTADAPPPLRRRLWWGAAVTWTLLVSFFVLARGTWVAAQIKLLLGLGAKLGLEVSAGNPLMLTFHLVSFFVMGLLYATALGGGAWRTLTRPTLVRCGLALVLLGGVLEYLQRFVPNRGSTWDDLVANALGSSLALLLAGAVGRWRRR